MALHEPISFSTKDGKCVLINEMGESYIFAGDMKPNPHTGGLGCCTADGTIDPKTATPTPVFEEYHRQAMRRYGQSVILAWHDDKVVGFEHVARGKVAAKAQALPADSTHLRLDAAHGLGAWAEDHCRLADQLDVPGEL